MATTTYYKLVTIKYKGEDAKFKIRSASKSSDIQDAIRARFDLASDQAFSLIDTRDQTDVVVDGTLTTGTYTLDDLTPSCCPPGSLPATAPPADYKLQGSDEKWDGLDVYVTGKSSNKAIIFFHDIFGSNSGRTKQLADEFALSGFLVVIPDLFTEERWTEKSDWANLPAYIKKFNWAKVGPPIESLIKQLEKRGITKFASIGFCWGTWPVLVVSASGKFSCGVQFHPSHPRICEAYGESQTALLEAVKCPQLVCAAGNDPPSVKEGGADQKTLSTKSFAKENIFREFPDVVHGFSVRGDVSDKTIAKNVRDVVDLATSFFKKHLN